MSPDVIEQQHAAWRAWLAGEAAAAPEGFAATLRAWRARLPPVPEMARLLRQGEDFVRLAEEVLRRLHAGLDGDAFWQGLPLPDPFEPLAAPLAWPRLPERMAELLPPGLREPLAGLLAGSPLAAELGEGFGLGRVAALQDDWLALGGDWNAWLDAERGYRELLAAAGARARAELRTHAEAHPPTSVRALYERWIALSERRYDALLRGGDYAEAHARLLHAALRLRRRWQRIAGSVAGLLGQPNRAALDTAERRLHATRQRLRALEDAVDALRALEPAATPPRGKPQEQRR